MKKSVLLIAFGVMSSVIISISVFGNGDIYSDQILSEKNEEMSFEEFEKAAEDAEAMALEKQLEKNTKSGKLRTVIKGNADINLSEAISIDEKIEAIEHIAPNEFYEYCLDEVDFNAKAELNEVINNDHFSLSGKWIREPLMIIGDLPEDTKRLKIEEVEQIMTKKVSKLRSSENLEDAIEVELNKIAGAPDWISGSGIERKVYFLDEEKNEAIYLMMGSVIHVSTDANGNQIELPIGAETIQEPQPSQSSEFDVD